MVPWSLRALFKYAGDVVGDKIVQWKLQFTIIIRHLAVLFVEPCWQPQPFAARISRKLGERLHNGSSAHGVRDLGLASKATVYDGPYASFDRQRRDFR